MLGVFGMDERVSQVYDAGQFSLRGGIIDVYSFASQQPFRIEVFGDQVDSIRTFDIASQLSIEIKDQITILADNSSTQTLTEKVALTDYLPQDTIIWVEERKRCTAEFASAEQLNKEHEAIFASSEQMEALLTQNTNVDILHSETAYPERYSYILSLECEGQMQFNSSFDLLIKELEKWFEQSYECFIGVNDRKQQDRIEKIIDEFKPKDHILNLHFIRAGFQGGYIDHSTKTLLFTDHQIFNRFHASRLDDNSSQRERLTMEDLMTLKPGDYVTHIDYGVGKFGGLEKINNNGRVQETIRLVYKDNDILYVSIHAPADSMQPQPAASRQPHWTGQSNCRGLKLAATDD